MFGSKTLVFEARDGLHRRGCGFVLKRRRDMHYVQTDLPEMEMALELPPVPGATFGEMRVQQPAPPLTLIVPDELVGRPIVVERWASDNLLHARVLGTVEQHRLCSAD